MHANKAPYITESAQFFQAMTFSRVFQSSDYRYVMEIPVRQDFVPGFMWKKVYNDGTWSIVVEMAKKDMPYNVYMGDWLARANSATTFATREDFEEFRKVNEGTAPVCLADVVDTSPRVHAPDPAQMYVRRIDYRTRQWYDLAEPPKIPPGEPSRFRAPVPHPDLPVRARELPPHKYQLTSHADRYRDVTVMSSVPQQPQQPQQVQQQQRPQRRQREQVATPIVPMDVNPLPPISTPVASTSTVTRRNNEVEDAGIIEDPPIDPMKPFNINYGLREGDLAHLNDNQLKRQYTALKRKHDRAVKELRHQLAKKIYEQLGWYINLMKKRQMGPFRQPGTKAKKAKATTSMASSSMASTSMDSPFQVGTSAMTSAEGIIEQEMKAHPPVMVKPTSGPQPSSSAIVSQPAPVSFHSKYELFISANNKPPLPKRRKVSSPPVVPPKWEDSGEKIQRIYFSPCESLTESDKELLEQPKLYLGGCLSDWSDADSPRTQIRYRDRHVQRRHKHPVISHREYNRKKALAVKRGYHGPVSNSPFNPKTFCQNGQPEPPRWWRKSKRNKTKKDFSA